RAGRQRGTQLGLRLFRPERDNEDFALAHLGARTVLGEAQGRLKCVLVERVELPLKTGRIDAAPVCGDFHFPGVVGIGDSLQCNQNLHTDLLLGSGSASSCARRRSAIPALMAETPRSSSTR